MQVVWSSEGPKYLVGVCPHCRTHAQLDCLTFIERQAPPFFIYFCRCTHCNRGVIAEAMTPTAPLHTEPGLKRSFPDPDYELSVPPAVRAVLDQVYAAQKEQAWILVGIGCRVAMERVAALHGETEGMLGKKLDSLRKKYPALAGALENAELVKLVGNVAAHDTAYDLTEPEANAAIEFIEEVLRDVYILPARRQRVIDGLPKKKG